jgi:hypothetical protein
MADTASSYASVSSGVGRVGSTRLLTTGLVTGVVGQLDESADVGRLCPLGDSSDLLQINGNSAIRDHVPGEADRRPAELTLGGLGED